MACCTGQTKCNDTVTIGYLKTFVGNDILDSAGNAVSVNTTKPDSYCPTYAELTGGTLIPNFVDGGTNKWASNVDGISVANGSSYSSNKLVKVQDLKLTYTRYESITVSAATTSLSECGGSTTLGRTFKLKKTVKGMNDCSGGVPSTSTSEGNDTATTATYSSTQNWLTINGNTATAAKNGTVSSSTLTTVVKAAVNYKGATYTSTGITISQSGLTGAYESTGTSVATSIDLTYTPSTKTFGCAGGNYTVEAAGKYYTRYKWKDSCNVVYNDVYNDVQGSTTLQTKTGSFAEVLCPTTSYTSSSTVSYTWSGITSSVTFTQNCTQQCSACEDYIVWGSGTNNSVNAPCAGGDVTVSATVSGVKHIKEYVSGECQETGSATTSQTQSIVVTIPPNITDSAQTYTGSDTTSQGGTINYTIAQPGGCAECTAATTTTSWNNQTVSAAKCDTSKNITLSGVTTTTYTNCSPTTENVTSAVTVNFSANNTSNPTSYTFTFSDATVTVNQAAGPCECLNPTYAYKFDDISVPCSSAASTTSSATYTKYTNYSNCQTTSETGSSTVTIPALTCNDGNSRVVQAGGSATTLANASPKITQAGGCTCTSCTCNDLTVAQVSSLPSTSGNNITIARYSADCLTNVGVTENANWLSGIAAANGIVTASVSANTGNTSRSTTISISGRADGTTCTKNVTVSQDGVACTCNDLSAFSVSNISSASGTGVTVATYTASNCVTNISATTNAAWVAITGVSNGNVYANVSANTSDTGRTATISVSGSAAGTTCTKNASLTQNGVVCTCEDIVFTEKTTTIGSGATPSSGVVIASASFGVCTGSLGVASVNSEASSWLTASTSGNNVIIHAAANTGLSNDRSGTTTVTYKANSTDSSYNCSSSFTVTQLSVPCTCAALDYFITPIYTHFGSGGTHGNRVLVASGNTHGCGTLSSNTYSNMIDGGYLEVVDVDNSSYEKVAFYATILTNDTPPQGQSSPIPRTTGVYIYFTPKDPSIDPCGAEAFSLRQEYTEKVLAPCEDAVVVLKSDYHDCTAVNQEGDSFSNAYKILELKPKHDDETLIDYNLDSRYYRFNLNGNASESWIRGLYQIDCYGGVCKYGIFLNDNLNDSASGRTATIDYWVTRTESGVTKLCTTSSMTFHQNGCYRSECEVCENYTFDHSPWRLTNDLLNIPQTGETYNLTSYLWNDKYPSCLQDAVITVQNTPSWVSFNSSTNELTVDSLSSGKRTATITITVNSTCPNQYDLSQGIECECSDFTYYFGDYTHNQWQAITDYAPIAINGASNTYQIKVSGNNQMSCFGELSATTNSSTMITSLAPHHPNTSWMYDVEISEWPSSSSGQRSGVINLSLGEGNCPIRLVLLQNPKDCDCTPQSSSVTTTTLHGLGDTDYVARFEFMDVSCLSATVETQHGSTGVVSPSLRTEGNIIYVDVENTYPYTGCSQEWVGVKIYRTKYDGTVDLCLSTGTTVDVVNGCNTLSSTDYGYLDANTVNLNGVTPNSVHNIVNIIGTQVGQGDYLCYYFTATTQNTSDVDNLTLTRNGYNYTLSGRFLRGISTYITVDIYLYERDLCNSSATPILLQQYQVGININP